MPIALGGVCLTGRCPAAAAAQAWPGGKSSFVLKERLSWLLTENNEVMAEGEKQDLGSVDPWLAPHTGLRGPQYACPG